MLGYVLVIFSLQVDRDILQGLENFDSPAPLKLMHEGARENSFAASVTQVNEGATRVVKSIMPAVWVLVFPFALNPFEDLQERLKLYLSIGQLDVFKSTLASLPPALFLPQSHNNMNA